ncbi:XRE family transcriptional regulator [Acinetobacter boissieri]|uniref:Phage repressor protein C, contains Cro/C1-type HTH and peptisase s24 domains n=1 Tax=Acinetobacter boissieri TaxID=1219383 RepID=A0A1G6IQN7_9GAMM|nr:helix-turn-helix transcriptional regulator [Acinetobacter boissieri]SDC08743.1 Phage repressor protein C, contains Cro/C1-type HTH and peptisase s24 domains [Acinetobacter boissieri]
MSDLASRLKTSRLKANKSQADVAESVGIKQPTYQALESGKTKKSAFIPLIAEFLSVDPLWLATGKNPEAVFDIHTPTVVDSSSDNDFIWIDIVEASFSCGDGESIEFHFDTIKGKFPFPPSFFSKKGVCKNNMKIIKAKGDSMTDLINDGDYVGIDTAQTEIIDGGIYAIYFTGEAMVKQIFKEADGSVVLHSLNTKYRDRIVNEQNGSSFRVMGRQFWRAG